MFLYTECIRNSEIFSDVEKIGDICFCIRSVYEIPRFFGCRKNGAYTKTYKNMCKRNTKLKNSMEKDILKISRDGEKVSVSVGDPDIVVKVVTELLMRQMSEGYSNGILLLN